MELWRYQVVWTGWSGAPGYSTFFADATDAPQGHADQVFNLLGTALSDVGGVTNYLPNGVKLTFGSVMDRVDAGTNDLIGTAAVTPPSTITGVGGNLYSAASGACITWRTALFVQGRRVVGRTFLIPLNGSAYGDDGTLGADFLTKARSAAATYIAAAVSTPVVMMRATPTHPGGAAPIIAGSITDQAAVLRSRR